MIIQFVINIKIYFNLHKFVIILKGKITGKSVGEISDSFPVRITPAGYAFSIWGLIYTLQAIFVLS